MDRKRLLNNIADVHARITKAAIRAGRNPQDITLVAVTKQVTPEIMEWLIDSGIGHLGENKVLDARSKKDACRNSDRVQWHMIGHLQRNKVKEALRIFDRFHSVDNIGLAKELDQYAAKRWNDDPEALPPRRIPILLEVNISGEASKYGFQPQGLAEHFPGLLALPCLEITGLMTMAPQTNDMDLCRSCFRQLRLLAASLREKYVDMKSFRQLSMGMSQDFEVAIEEGATLVRIGSALFKEE